MPAPFADRLDTLVRPLDPARHAHEIALLQRCRSLPELEGLVGWLSPEGQAVRLKLVRHGSGTLLVVSYDQGWSSTLSQG
ncbi:MAG: hypothetical protein R3F59_16755 [Myxococcota bacterium]